MQRNRITGVVAMLLVSGVGLVGATPAGATASGTNGRIAYSRFADAAFRHADIVSANPDGTGVVKLTRSPDGTYDFNPDWKPDGTEVNTLGNAGAKLVPGPVVTLKNCGDPLFRSARRY